MQAANVLLVNHSAQAQQVARELAMRLGYVPHTASNAFEALFQLGASPIHAVVCEADLPGRNSQWLRERITQLHPDTLFVVSERGTGPEWERAVEQLQPVTPAGRHPDAAAPDPQAGSAIAAIDAIDPDAAADPDVTIAPLALPPELEVPAAGADRRRAPRYRPSAHLPVLLRGGREGMLRDVSAGGALIETDAHVGPRRVFELRVGNAADMLRAMVQVVRCDVVAVTMKGVIYRVGVAFKDPLSDSDIKKLVSGGAP